MHGVDGVGILPNGGAVGGGASPGPGQDVQVAAGSPAEPPCVLVLSGSPRAHGRCSALAREIALDLARTVPRDKLHVLHLAGARIAGCVGCDACRTTGECRLHDDMDTAMGLLDAADELHVVSPVYFSGPPSQMKAFLDRLQPHYWKGTRALPKRPAHLHVVGEGGDPHGYGPLVTICRSALAVAGFDLVEVVPHIGGR